MKQSFPWVERTTELSYLPEYGVTPPFQLCIFSPCGSTAWRTQYCMISCQATACRKAVKASLKLQYCSKCSLETPFTNTIQTECRIISFFLEKSIQCLRKHTTLMKSKLKDLLLFFKYNSYRKSKTSDKTFMNQFLMCATFLSVEGV